MDDGSSDPGWGDAWKGIVALPLLPLLAKRTLTGGDGLLLLRRLFTTYCAALVAVGIVGYLLCTGHRPAHLTSGTTAAIAVGAFGVVILVIGRLIDRPLKGDDPVTIAGAYRSRFFLRLALGESPALAGFVGVLRSDNPAVYLVGLGIAVLGLARAAPTARSLAHDQQQLAAAGSPLHLITCLRSPAGPAPDNTGGPPPAF